MQQRQAVLVVALGILGQLEGQRSGVGKGAGWVEQAAGSHHLAGGIEKQRCQAWMKIVIDHQGGGGCEHRRVLGRGVGGQIEQAFTDPDAVEVRQPRRIGRRAAKTGQA